VNPKVLLIIHRLTYGGAGKVMAFLANKLSVEGFDVYLLTYEGGELMQFLAASVHRVQFRYPPPPIPVLKRVLQIVQLKGMITRIKPDLAISFLPYPNMISIAACKAAGVPIIIAERGDPSAHRSWFTAIRDIFYNFADGCVFQTCGAQKYYPRNIQAKGVIIPNPVDADKIPVPWSGERDDTIVNVGRFDLEDKRQDLLIKAFARVADRFPDIKLILIGDGKDQKVIEHVIAECHLKERVILPGATMNVYAMIRKAKVFVLSSDHEGYPNALIEAMSVGLPCISTNCPSGAPAEIIQHMENGMLIEPGSIDELADAMAFLLENPETAAAMGTNARQIIPKLDGNTIIEQWKSYITKFMGETYSSR